jgi:hypothetical protein
MTSPPTFLAIDAAAQVLGQAGDHKSCFRATPALLEQFIKQNAGGDRRVD